MEGETLILTYTWTEFWTEDVCKYGIWTTTSCAARAPDVGTITRFRVRGRPGRGRRGQGGRFERDYGMREAEEEGY